MSSHLSIFYVFRCFTGMYVCSPCVSDARGGQKVSDCVVVEVQTLVNCHIGAWNLI